MLEFPSLEFCDELVLDGLLEKVRSSILRYPKVGEGGPMNTATVEPARLLPVGRNPIVS
jgi:hypothetical protein